MCDKNKRGELRPWARKIVKNHDEHDKKASILFQFSAPRDPDSFQSTTLLNYKMGAKNAHNNNYTRKLRKEIKENLPNGNRPRKITPCR